MIWSMSSPSHKCVSHLISCPISSTLTSPSHDFKIQPVILCLCCYPIKYFYFFPSLNTKLFFKLWHFKKYMLWYPPIFFSKHDLELSTSSTQCPVLFRNTIICPIPRTFHEYTFIPLSFSK